MSTLPKFVVGTSLTAAMVAAEPDLCNKGPIKEKLKSLAQGNKVGMKCEIKNPAFLGFQRDGDDKGDGKFNKTSAEEGTLNFEILPPLKYITATKDSASQTEHGTDTPFALEHLSPEHLAKTNFKPGVVKAENSDDPKCELKGEFIEITNLKIQHGKDNVGSMYECTAGHTYTPPSPPPPTLKRASDVGYGKDNYTEGTFECSIDQDSGKFLALKSDKIVIKKDDNGKGKVDAWTLLKFADTKVYSDANTEAKEDAIGAVGKINPGNSKPNDLDELEAAFQDRTDGNKVYHDLVLRGQTTNKLSLKKEFNDEPKKIDVEMTCKETKGKGGDPEKDKPKEKTCCEKYCCAITFGVIGGVVLIGGIAAYFLLANKGDDAGDEEEEEEDEEGEGDEE